MSRLIVKNLPNNITPEKLREIFLQKGEITDVQLKYTKEGKFRNFGFVGYRTEEQANEALNYFNGTCIKSNRIKVESCVPLGSSVKPKAWSKYAPESSAYKKIHGIEDKPKPEKPVKPEKQTDKVREILEKYKEDPMFAEFMDVHGTDVNKKLSEAKPDESDSDKDDDDDEDEDDEPTESTDKLANQRISDFEYMKSLMGKSESAETADTIKKKKPKNRILYMVKIRGITFATKKKDVKEFFKPLVPFTIRIPHGKKITGFCYAGFRTEEERKKALFKNKNFLGGQRVTVIKFDKNSLAGTEENDKDNSKHKQQEESIKNEESIAESGKIYVRNLPYITTEDEIQALFEKFGPVAEVNMPVDKTTHRPKGFAHITFMMPEHAVQAFSELDGSVFCGRMMHLLPGKQKEEKDLNDDDLTFKEKKELKQKSQAGSSHNWNTLFLGANAVADVVADNLSVTKEKLLEGDKNMSAAVKLALGETQIVAETRQFLEESGICLDAFNQAPKKRSKTIILIKNLPAKTTRGELEAVFKPFGLIARLVIPPNGISAIIEFVEPSEARQAFSKLAYSKFKYLPLYLEWAPDNAFLKPAEIPKINVESPAPVVNQVKDESKDESEEDEPEPNTILFVKGLNFTTNEESLRKHFEACGRLHSVTIAKKRDPHNPGEKLSMGYGFVQFYSKNTTDNALKALQMSTLDDKQIELKRSERNGSNEEVKTTRKTTQVGKQTGTKILVRNVPFQANRKEIYDIFGAFGEIKALRLPKKMVSGEDRHKGFCFVEYHNKSDSKKAFNALCQSTHLYGRRLVLEWAKHESEDNVLDTLRKRTAETFYTDVSSGKKSRKSIATLETMNDNAED